MSSYNKGDRAVADKLTGKYEHNNHLQGRSGGGTKKKPGPANSGKSLGTPSNSGGINRPTHSKSD